MRLEILPYGPSSALILSCYVPFLQLEGSQFSTDFKDFVWQCLRKVGTRASWRCNPLAILAWQLLLAPACTMLHSHAPLLNTLPIHAPRPAFSPAQLLLPTHPSQAGPCRSPVSRRSARASLCGGGRNRSP